MNDTALPHKSQPPVAVAGATISLAGIDCKTYILEDGRRVIDAHDFDSVWIALMNGAALSDEEASAFSRFRGGVAVHG